MTDASREFLALIGERDSGLDERARLGASVA